MNGKRIILPVIFLMPIVIGDRLGISGAQVIGELAEMDRLGQRADELAAQADPEGAAQASGKAAMMADILTKNAPDPSTQNTYQAASLQYRAQERGLRALALFERAGGLPPAPPGVCHYLLQATTKLSESKTLLLHLPNQSQQELPSRQNHLLKKNEEWEAIFKGLHEDFACPE
ncbi:MAG: hypothetical protein AB7P17_00525 [Nitrospirales bacterium]|nr:hypothetical protein [Nitrospirales bacterium]